MTSLYNISKYVFETLLNSLNCLNLFVLVASSSCFRPIFSLPPPSSLFPLPPPPPYCLPFFCIMAYIFKNKIQKEIENESMYSKIYRLTEKNILKSTVTIHLTDDPSKLKGALANTRTSQKNVWPPAGPLHYAGIATKNIYGNSPQRGIVLDVVTFVDIFGKAEELVAHLKAQAQDIITAWNDLAETAQDRGDVTEDFLVKEVKFLHRYVRVWTLLFLANLNYCLQE